MSNPFPPYQPPPSPLQEINAQTGRTYIHKECGGATTVTGSSLVGLCNPFEIVMGTMCVHCRIPDSTKHFVWEDTGENVSKYRRRGVAQMPLLALISWLVLPAIAAAICGLIASNFQGKFGPLTNLGAVLGAGGIYVFLGPIIVRAFASKRIINRDRTPNA